MKELNKLSQEIHGTCRLKGFYDKPTTFAEKAMLIVTEISEAVEAHRVDVSAKPAAAQYALQFLYEDEFKDYFLKNVKDTVEDELADAVIRILDLCGHMNIDIDSHVKAKMRYNSYRPHLHGKKY